MLQNVKRVYQFFPALLLLATLFAACQNGVLSDQIVACPQRSFPKVTILTSARSLSGAVYVASGPDLYSLALGNGALHWCSKIAMTDGTDEFGNIAIDGPMIYANTLSTHLLAIRSLSGTLAWDENVAEEDSQFPSSIVNNTIYVGLVALSAINAQNGKVLWQYLLPPQTGIKTTPVVAGGTVYFGTMALQTKQPEQLIAVDATTGKKRWALSLKSTGLRDVVVGGGVIMLSGMDLSTETGWVDAVNAQNGHLLWQKPFSPDLSAPIEADGILYITEDIFSSDGSDNTTLDAINIHTGTVEWSIAGAEPSLFVSGILYSIDAAGRIVARSTINGHVLWQAQLQMPLLVGSPTRLVLLDGEIFVGMRYLNGTHATFFLDAFNLNTHQEDWYANITGIETSTGSNISVAV